jgi:Transmembrane secretion effector
VKVSAPTLPSFNGGSVLSQGIASAPRAQPAGRRDSAYAWGAFEDAAVSGRVVETFFLESLLEHLRQHERVTNADRVLQDAVANFHVAGAPTVSHLIAASPGVSDGSIAPEP